MGCPACGGPMKTVADSRPMQMLCLSCGLQVRVGGAGKRCPKCRGKKVITCDKCGGRGILTVSGHLGVEATCAKCSATGAVACPVCGGAGSPADDYAKTEQGPSKKKSWLFWK